MNNQMILDKRCAAFQSNEIILIILATVCDEYKEETRVGRENS